MGMTLAEQAKFKKLQRTVAKQAKKLDKFENHLTATIATAVERTFSQFEVQEVDHYQKTKDYLLGDNHG